MLKVDRTPSPLRETRSRSSASDGQTEQARFGQAVTLAQSGRIDLPQKEDEEKPDAVSSSR
jgi:hypothetical protein